MVERLILLAAGKGERLKPLTINTPKPLIRVHGVRIIDTLLDAAISNGISSIYIVRGFLQEQFDVLLKKYPNIKFIENPDFESSNNISSVYAARELLEDAFICEADLLLRNPTLMNRNQEISNYLGVKTRHTDDWCFQSKEGIITGISVGGDNCHHMFGLSYWSKEDAKKLLVHIEELYQQDFGKKLYWDEVALKYYLKEYQIHIRECSFDDITEIDTLKELQILDNGYLI